MSSDLAEQQAAVAVDPLRLLRALTVLLPTRPLSLSPPLPLLHLPVSWLHPQLPAAPSDPRASSPAVPPAPLSSFWTTCSRHESAARRPLLRLDKKTNCISQRKINTHRQQYADNQNISLLPAIVSTSTRMHGEFLRLLFLQAHRKTEAHFTAAGMSSQRNHSDSFRFKRAAFYQSLKSKVGLAAAKAAALRINLNVEGCGIVAAPVHATSRAPLLLPLLLSHNLPLPRVH